MYDKQFLLSKVKVLLPKWTTKKIGNFYLNFDSKSEYSFVNNNHIELNLLGNLYDWDNPEFSNTDVLTKLSKCDSIDMLLIDISKYSGQYVLIYQKNEDLIIFNDATAQSEIYYNTKFEAFASQPKLIGEVTVLLQHSNLNAKEFYSSDIFKKKCLFVGESTYIKNIKHLLPNHYINVTKNNIKRFFPFKPINILPVDEVAQLASRMLVGYIRAISLVHGKIAMAVTGGYDSRVLFLASLESECKYYVSKHPNMADNHYDIVIPQKLTSIYNKSFVVIPDENNIKFSKEYINSIDCPRYLNINSNLFLNHIFINGNISEIARNYFGYYKNPSPEDLSYLSGFSINKFTTVQYDKYIKQNKNIFDKLGFNLLDMFYWEEKMGIWAAKSKTEFNALGRTIVSPFNSRDLLTLLLSTKRNYRDSHYNKLYDKIIFYLSHNNKEVMKLPINPCKKQNIIKLMKKIRVYNLYRFMGLKTRKLSL